MKNFVMGALLALGLGLWSWASADAQGVAIAQQIEAKAIVESIDQATRTILLRNEDGSLASVKAGSEVRNFAQVKPGDQVVVRVRLGVVAQMAPTNGAGAPVAETDLVGRTPAGDKPGAYVGETMRIRVTFLSYNPKTKTVDFTLSSGEQANRVLQTKPMQDFAAGLKPVDKVDLTFVKSIAVAVLPAK